MERLVKSQSVPSFAQRSSNGRSQTGLGTSARQLIKQIAEIKSVDVIVPVRRAGTAKELRLGAVTTPESATAQLYEHLVLRLPE